MNRKEGFIDLETILQQMGINTIRLTSILDNPKITVIQKPPLNLVFSFEYEKEIYFYKCVDHPYNELVAFYLLQDYGLNSLEYDLASLGSLKGVLSKNFKKKNVNYIYMEDILVDYWQMDIVDIEDYNNLEDIWDALENRYQNYENKREIVEKLMRTIVDIFLFDIICDHQDRHSGNLLIAESQDRVDIQLFDNERILSQREMVSLTVNDRSLQNIWMALKTFLRISSEEFQKIIIEKLWIISDENLFSVFQKIKDQTGYEVPKHEKDYYLMGFQKHREKLIRMLQKQNMIESDGHYERKNR